MRELLHRSHMRELLHRNKKITSSQIFFWQNPYESRESSRAVIAKKNEKVELIEHQVVWYYELRDLIWPERDVTWPGRDLT